MHGVLVGLDRMHLARPAASSGSLAATKERLAAESFTALLSVSEPRPHSREHAHETAGLQQLAPKSPTGAQIGIQFFLVQFVHVQETVSPWLGESCILYIFPHDTGSLLFTTPEEVSAVVVMMYRLSLFRVVTMLEHGLSS